MIKRCLAVAVLMRVSGSSFRSIWNIKNLPPSQREGVLSFTSPPGIPGDACRFKMNSHPRLVAAAEALSMREINARK